MKDSGGPVVSEYLDTVLEMEETLDAGSWKDGDDRSDESNGDRETQQ